MVSDGFVLPDSMREIELGWKFVAAAFNREAALFAQLRDNTRSARR